MNIEHRTSNIQRRTKCLSNPQSVIRNPQWIIHRFESVTSTNDAAIRMAEEGAPEGTVVIASEQTGGRGRHGRHWTSPPGAGLYLSIVLRPDIPFEHLWQLAFVAAVASAETVSQTSGLPAQIKWPNDVLLCGKKVCGILVEAKPPVAGCQLPVASRPPRSEGPVPLRKGDSPESSPPCEGGVAEGRGGHSQIRNPQSAIGVIGIGINVNSREFPTEIVDKATSIALELGRPIAIEDVENALLSRLDTWYCRYLKDGFASVLGAWKNLDCTIGRRVAIESIEGAAVDISESGDLIVQRDDGSTVSISAGDVILRNAKAGGRSAAADTRTGK